MAGLYYNVVDSPQAVASGEQLCPPLKKKASVSWFFFFFKISPTSLLHWQMFVLCEATCRALCMLSLCVALFSWWIWEVNTPPSLEPCFRDLSRRNPHVSFDFLLSLPCTNSFSLCASSWLIGGQRWTQWCCSEDKNQLVVISWVLMTDVLPLFSLLAFSSTISKHFTNVTYVDLVRKNPHVVVKTANLTWNDEASIGGQKSVDQHPWVFWFFWDVVLVF